MSGKCQGILNRLKCGNPVLFMPILVKSYVGAHLGESWIRHCNGYMDLNLMQPKFICFCVYSVNPTKLPQCMNVVLELNPETMMVMDGIIGISGNWVGGSRNKFVHTFIQSCRRVCKKLYFQSKVTHLFFSF